MTKKFTSRDLAKLISQAANDTKAEDLIVIDLRKISGFTDYFVIASGRSDRQVQAIADRIDEALEKAKIVALSKEGYPTGHWILLDYGDVVAHIFYSETREFYGLDKLWGDAPRVKFRLK